MDENFFFLNFDGLDDVQIKALKNLIHPSNHNCQVEFPWRIIEESKPNLKNTSSWLNVNAPEFKSCALKVKSHLIGMNNYVTLANQAHIDDNVRMNNIDTSSNFMQNHAPILPFNNAESIPHQRIIQNASQPTLHENTQISNNVNSYTEKYQENGNALNGSQNIHPSQMNMPVAEFKLNPTASSFVSQKITPLEHSCISNGEQHIDPSISIVESNIHKNESNTQEINLLKTDTNTKEQETSSCKTDSISQIVIDEQEKKSCTLISNESNTGVKQTFTQNQNSQNEEKKIISTPPVNRSWADVLKKDLHQIAKAQTPKHINENGTKVPKIPIEENVTETLLIEEDKQALKLGKHLHQLSFNFQPVFLQPRGLVNRRNWCYINATLQALVACSPFYTLLKNLPIGPGVERGKSSTPVIDSMVKVAYEFEQLSSAQEEVQMGPAFQPDFIYEMLRDLKSDCLKGQQEDAEEFLSFILNGMHEEMVKLIKNYEKLHNLNGPSWLRDKAITVEDAKVNGDISDGEEEWHIVSLKNKGMITRKVTEHKTPISDLIGGTKSFLTTCGNKTTASVQPFFTLQLDVQSENVNSVNEALNRMAIKEPIQGYTCAKTKQEIEAFSHISLQKLPPILILHLKRFVYNKNGCKKVMKKTDYPIYLELDKELFSPELRRSHRFRSYKLFAVMYHDGEEAIKGHYVSDVYHHGSQSWIRCDDRTVSPVTEEQVLSHNPPRVPYLLFYQENINKELNLQSGDSPRTSCR